MEKLDRCEETGQSKQFGEIGMEVNELEGNIGNLIDILNALESSLELVLVPVEKPSTIINEKVKCNTESSRLLSTLQAINDRVSGLNSITQILISRIQL
jgi:hypothetical protein